MKFNLNNKYFRWGLTAFLVIVASICFYYLMFHASNIKAAVSIAVNLILPIMFGFVIAYLMTPLLNHIEYYILIPFFKWIKLKETSKTKGLIRGIGITLTSCLVFAVIYLLCFMMLSQIVPSIMNIISNFDTYITNFTVWINGILEDNPTLGNYVNHMINKYSVELENWLNGTVLTKTSELIKSLSLSVISVVGVLWDFIIGFIIAVYVLISKEKFAGQAKKIAYAVFEKSTANVVIRNFRFTHKTFIGFVGGKIIDSLIIGCLCFVGTTLLKTPYAVLVSLVIGVTNIIPFFGPFLGAIPCIILIFVVDPLNPLNCLYFAIFVFALQQFDGNILGPKILGDSTGLSGFWVIFSITLFGGFFGVPGMVVGVPVFAVIYASIRSLVNASLEKKNMPKDTTDYINLAYVDEKGYHEYVPEYKQKKIARENKKKNQDDDKEN